MKTNQGLNANYDLFIKFGKIYNNTLIFSNYISLVDNLGIHWQVALALILLSMKVLNNIEANIRNFNVKLIAKSEYFKVEYKKDFVNYEKL